MYSTGQLGFNFSITDAWDGIRQFFGVGNTAARVPATSGQIVPGYQSSSLPWPVGDLIKAGANVTDVDNLATISDWAQSVAAGNKTPTREPIPLLHAGELAELTGTVFDAGAYTLAPDDVIAADHALQPTWTPTVNQLLTLNQFTTLPAATRSAITTIAGIDTGELLKWGGLSLAVLLLARGLRENPPRRRRRTA